MAALDFEVIGYTVQLHGVLESQSRPQGGVPFKSVGRLVCNGSQGETLSIYLVAADSPMPEGWYEPEQKWGRAFVPSQQYALFLDLLRNEAPIYAVMHSDKPRLNGLRTTLEIVGDGDY